MAGGARRAGWGGPQGRAGGLGGRMVMVMVVAGLVLTCRGGSLDGSPTEGKHSSGTIVVTSAPTSAPVVIITHSLMVTVYVLASLYAALALVPVIQLIRIHRRVPHIGWTLQKIFLVLTFVVNTIRASFFLTVPELDNDTFFLANFKYPIFTILDDFPSVLFFSTYTLLILFWAEIINHARNQSVAFTRRIRLVFLVVNMVAYLVQITIWLLLFFLHESKDTLDIADNLFKGVVAVLAATGFVVYGGRLFCMLRSIQIESKGRRNKLREVGWVTVICTLCFTARSFLIVYSTFATDLDVKPFWIACFYGVAEIVPSALVLYILRKLPPKRSDREASNKLINNDPPSGNYNSTYYDGGRR